MAQTSPSIPEPQLTQLPETGISWGLLETRLHDLKGRDFDWRGGRLPSYTYFFNDDTLQVQRAAYAAYIIENGLANAKVFGSVAQMTADVIAMTSGLFHAPPGSGGSFTSGGTESVFQALKTARDHARATRGTAVRGQFNVVAPISAHACMNKAAHLLDLEVRRTPVDDQWRSDPPAIEAAIDEQTILIYASAPCYPYGVIDRIAELGQLAADRGLWLHVDGCWGGFVSPFAEELGYPIRPWDFRIPGVTSLSADIHKFGFSAKGASVILYRDAALQEFERFEFDGWPRGMYTTPTFLGTKPAGSIASAWAVMQYLGKSGYLEATAQTMTATDRLVEGVSQIEGLRPLEPNGESNIAAFTSTDEDVDIMAVADELEARGWFRGRLREPLAIQQGVMPAHLPVMDDYLVVVAESVEKVRSQGLSSVYDEHTY